MHRPRLLGATLLRMTFDRVGIDQAHSEDPEDMVHRIGFLGTDLALMDQLPRISFGLRVRLGFEWGFWSRFL